MYPEKKRCSSRWTMGWMGIEIKGTGSTVWLENSAFYVDDLEP
jgi:hypothetical protein